MLLVLVPFILAADSRKRVEDSIEFKRNFIGTLVIEHQYCKQKEDLLGSNCRVHLH